MCSHSRYGFFLLLAVLLPSVSAAVPNNDECDDEYDACQLKCYQTYEDIVSQGGNAGAAGVGLAICSSICMGQWVVCEVADWFGELGWFVLFDIEDDAGAGIKNLARGVTAIPQEPTVITLRAGRWNGSAFIPSAGSVTDVNFYAAPIATAPPDTLISAFSPSWVLLGAGVFNSSTGLWEFEWEIADPAVPGYVLAAEFLDPTIGLIPGVNDEIPLGQIVGRHVLITGEITLPVPTTSQWGRVVLTGLLLGSAAVFLLGHRWRRRGARLT